MIRQGLPFGIGKFWGIPIPGAEAAWYFGDLHKTLGPIYQWTVFGTDHVWIETDKIARDLFVQRGKKYGDRHELPAAVGVRGGSEILPLMGIGKNFWRHKNFIHTTMRYSSQEQFWGFPTEENKRTLKRMIEKPDHWSEHLVTHCARVAAYCAWGDPKHGTKLFHVVPVLLKAVSPGGPMINLLTFLINLPTWLSPWAYAEKIRKKAMADAFYEGQQDVIGRVAEGTAGPSWTRIWLENMKGMEKSKLDQHEAAHAVGTSALVAIVTIGSPLHTFFTAMCHYPHWMPKLQEEVDRVCGDRLPTLADMPQLPVLRSVIKECLRWRQPTPLGVPHVTTEDDIYNGYFIPKGAMVHANHYLISREPSLYPEGHEFRPERWLDPAWPSYKEPLTEYPTLRNDCGFGYGPRGCPGIELILTELYTLIGSLVWAFDITRKSGKEGYDHPVPWYETNPYVITMAKPFPCDIVPRSEEKRRFRWVAARRVGLWRRRWEREVIVGMCTGRRMVYFIGRGLRCLIRRGR